MLVDDGAILPTGAVVVSSAKKVKPEFPGLIALKSKAATLKVLVV